MLSSPHLGPRQSIGDFLPSPGPIDSSLAGPSRSKTIHGIELEEEEDVLEEDTFQLARSYFDMKEFDRVVYKLRHAMGSRARFLRIYAAYLVRIRFRGCRESCFIQVSQSADRRAQESLPHFLDSKEERVALYPSLTPLISELAGETEPYLVYLLGLLHMRLDQRPQAIACFTASLKSRPYNWSCWSQLGQMISSPDQVRNVLPFELLQAEPASLSS